MTDSPQRWDDEFPILRTWTYLDHATFGPAPLSHVRASQDAARRMSELPIADIGASGLMEQLRTVAAELLHCESENLALLKCTSEGIDLVSQGITWQAGDEVILYEGDFPGTLAPWLALARRGVVPRMILDGGRRRFDAGDVEALIGPRTRVICLSLVNSDHGFRAPIAEISELARPHGIWLAVDAVQGIGSLDVDVEALGADIVAAHGYKFLLSGFGVALVFCSERAIRELEPTQIGWKNAPDSDRVGVPVQGGGARRFESTIASIPSVAGMCESVALLNSVGTAQIEAHVRVLLDELALAAASKGYQVRSSRSPAEASALLSIRHPSLDIAAVQEALKQAHVACAVRNASLRIAPHFYNSASDIERLVNALPA